MNATQQKQLRSLRKECIYLQELGIYDIVKQRMLTAYRSLVPDTVRGIIDYFDWYETEEGQDYWNNIYGKHAIDFAIPSPVVFNFVFPRTLHPEFYI